MNMPTLIVSMGISALVISVYASMSTNNAKSRAKITKQENIESVRRVVRLRVDCEAMQTAWSGCSENDVISLKKSDNSDLTQIGKFQLKTTCGQFSNTYFIEYRMENEQEYKPLFSVPYTC